MSSPQRPRRSTAKYDTDDRSVNAVIPKQPCDRSDAKSQMPVVPPLRKSRTKRPPPSLEDSPASKKKPYCQNAYQKGKFKLDIDDFKIPDYPIELYWEDERQWWPFDYNTTIHKFSYCASGDRGRCQASWHSRRKIECKWRRIREQLRK
jgi:hypothetical protein